MGGMFSDGLTKSGLQAGDQTKYYDSPEQTMQAANEAYPAVNAAAQGVPQLTPNGGIEFKSSPVQAPKVVKPTFAQASENQLMNPSKPSGMTRAGFLVNMLMGGLQGALAGAGARTFGEGAQRGMALPFQQARARQEAQQGELDTQMKQEQLAQIPFLRQQRERQAVRENLISTPRGVYDISKAAYVPGTEPDPRVASPEQQVYDQLIKSGKNPLEALEAIKTVGQDGTPKTPTTPFQAYQQAFKTKFNRDMSPEEISAWEKQHAQNIHVNTPKSGSDEEISYAAQQLVDPRNLTALRNIASMRGDQRLKIFNAASKLDPTFDPGLTDRRIKFLDNYENPAGRSAINRQAINNILQHGADLLDLNNQYRRSDVRVLNTPINAIARQFGDQAYTQFQTVNGVLKDELSLYFAGGYAPTQDQQKMWDKIQADEATPAQTEAFAREVGKLAFRRANTFNSNFRSIMGYDDPNMITPEAKVAAQKLGLGEEVKKFGSGGQIGGRGSGSKAPSTSTTGEGDSGWEVKNGIRVRKTAP